MEVHLHALATDGASEALPDAGTVFHPATELNDGDLRVVLVVVVQPAIAVCAQSSSSSPTLRWRPRLHASSYVHSA